MALKIRLARGGAKKRPFYRIVVADSRSPRDGRFIEKIGTYNPMLARENTSRVQLDLEKAKDWLSKGAQPTDRVLRFLDAAGLMKRDARSNPNKAEPGQKAKERAAEKAEKLAAAEEAARAPAAEPEVVAEVTEEVAAVEVAEAQEAAADTTTEETAA